MINGALELSGFVELAARGSKSHDVESESVSVSEKYFWTSQPLKMKALLLFETSRYVKLPSRQGNMLF